jgi:predicted transcriptional regulator
MGKNRDRLSLVAAILEAVSAGSGKTRIMFAANLSFKLLEKYLQTALSVGFIQLNGSGYELTAYGREFLMQYMNFEDRYVRVQSTLQELTREREQLERLCKEGSCGIIVEAFKMDKP